MQRPAHLSRQKASLKLLYMLGLASFAVFLVVQSPDLMGLATVTTTEYGGLYLDAKIDRFKIPLPPTPEPLPANPALEADDYRIFTVGDSFFGLDLGYYDFSTQLAQRLEQPVHYLGHVRQAPFAALTSSTRRSRPVAVVLEVLERDMAQVFTEVYPQNLPPPSKFRETGSGRELNEETVFLPLERLSRFNELCAYFLKRNRLSFFLSSRYETFMFERYGKISPRIGAYTTDPPMLFVRNTITTGLPGTFFYHHTDSLINRVADNIAATRDSLRLHYNAAFVFLPIPNKITVYHERVTDRAYDNLLPRLYDALEERGVAVVRLYSPFRQHPRPVYYASDIHWNAEGMSIALDQVTAALDSLAARESVPGARLASNRHPADKL